jgi:hypothetical protein
MNSLEEWSLKELHQKEAVLIAWACIAPGFNGPNLCEQQWRGCPNIIWLNWWKSVPSIGRRMAQSCHLWHVHADGVLELARKSYPADKGC